jgi:thiosulfate dehydrogenase [quinone] large subunit
VTNTMVERGLIVFFRISIGWIFLHAGFDQVTAPHFSAVPFLSHTKTFHDILAIFTTPAIAPVVSFIVAWGQVLLGLSLISGTFIRLSAPFGILLMLLFYFAHMDWPYNESRFYFIVGPHLIYAAVICYLLIKRAGNICGIDGFLTKARR